MKSVFRTYARHNNGRLLRLLQCGTALPLLATAVPALATPIQESSDGDVTISAAEATGTPIAVEVQSTGGAIDVAVTTVTATAVAGDRDYVVGLETLTGGNITGNFGSITGTGEGELLALGAQSYDGAIDLTVGTIDVGGTATSGITAHSVNGTVTITADSVIARGTGMDSQSEFFEAVQGVSDNNSVSIDVGHAETHGDAGSAIGAIAGGTATIVADTAVAHADGVIVAYANAAGDASVDIGSVTLTAEDGQGLYVTSAGGSATVTVDTIETGDLAEAARVLAAGDIDVTLGNVNAGGGLTATSNGGDVTVAVEGDIVGRTYGGMGLTGETVTVTMAEGSSISAAGDGWNGIFASASDAVDITATELATTGANGHAISVQSGLGGATIASGSVSTSGAGAYGLNVTSAGGDIAIASGEVHTSGTGQVFGISAISNGGGITIESGTVEVASTGADNGRGIQANSGGGDIVIDAGTTTGHTRAIFTTTLFEGPELGFTAGNTTITSESATATGGNAIIGQGYSVALTSGRAEGTANADFTAATIYVSAGEGGATVTAEETIAHGYGQYGIQVLSNGNLQIDSGSVTTDGQFGNGITAFGDAAITINSGTVSTSGADSDGIFVDGYTEYGSDPISITSDTVTTTGAWSDGIQVVAETADVSIESTGAITATGNGSNGIYVDGGTGDVALAVASVSTAGNLGSAILVEASGEIGISADEVAVSGPGADPGVRGDGSGLRVEQGGVIVEGGDGAITVAAGSVAVEGEHRYGISVRGNGAIDIAAEEVTLASADSVAVVARGGAGDVSITTGTVTTTGASGVGVFGNSTSGNITIVAGTTRVENAGEAGPFTGDAIVATSGSGAVSVTSADASSAALNGSAIVAISGGDVTLDSGIAATTGDGGVAVLAQSTNGTLTFASDTVTTTGADTRAIAAHAFNGVANVAIGDVTALGGNASGVLASGREVNLVVDGTVQSTQIAVNVSAQGGLANVVVNGSVASTDGVGLVSSAQNGVVAVSEGASVSGGAAGVVLLGGLQGGFTQFYNSGTVTGETGAAVAGVANPNGTVPSFYIQNNGVLAGSGGLAVVTAAGDDTLELTNLSQITGMADLGAGYDRLVLDLNDDAAADAVGQVAATINVEHLAVDSGTWRAATGNSFYESIEIEDGAHLIVAQDNEFISVIAPHIELDGRLDLELTTDTEPGQLTGLLIEGAGSVHLTGPAMLLVDDATGLQHTGGTFVENGELLLTTVYGGDIATSGEGVFELGEGGDFTGNLVNDGTFVFAQAGDYDFLGDFTGTGQLDKHGDGTLTFAGLYGFAGTTSVFGGTVAFTGQLSEDTELDISEGTVDLSQVEGGEQTIGQLSGEGGELQLGETQLVIDQFGNTVFSGSITGMGSLIKEGEGDLKLDGDGTGFTGTGQVDGGTMSVNGDFSNANFVVNEGGTLGGAGTIGSTQVDGGTLAPGNSIDTLTVDGDVTFTAASVFEVEVDAAGNSDLLQATGEATLGGASVNVIAASGIYRPQTDYTILTADGGVSGEFSSVDVNLAFLDPTLAYSANAVTLRLVRNNIDFAAYGETANQVAVGGLIESLGYGNALYDATLTLVDSDVAPSFASLTGEVYPAHSAAVIETAEMLRRQTTDAMVAEGAYAWSTGLYNKVSSGTGAGEIELVGKGIAGGFGFGGNGFSAALGLGLLDHSNGGGDFADGDVTFAIGQLAYTGFAGLSISAGAQLGWVDGETRRQTSLGTAGGAVAGGIDGDYLQLFGEIAYSVPMGSLSVEPFVGVSHVAAEFDGVTETGAATALAVGALERDVTFGDIGVRLSGDAGSGIRPFASAAYRHAWGDRASLAAVGFVGAGGTVPIAALPIAQDAAELSAGLAITSGQVEIEVGYDGTISKTFDSHGLSAALKFRF